MKSTKISQGKFRFNYFCNLSFYTPGENGRNIDLPTSKSVLPSFGYMQNENLAQYLGGAGNQNTSELLTNAHYDSEVG